MLWQSSGPDPIEVGDTTQGGLSLSPAVLPCVAGQGASTRLGIPGTGSG